MQCCKGMPEINDYGLPLDHPWCPPEERAACDVPLRTAEEYASMGGEILTAAPDAFCTCADDPDPVVAVFEHVINSEDAAAIINLARGKMKKAMVCSPCSEQTISPSRTLHCRWLTMIRTLRQDGCVFLLDSGHTLCCRKLVGGRTNSNCWLNRHHSPVVARVIDQVSEIVGLDPLHAEDLQVHSSADRWTDDVDRR